MQEGQHVRGKATVRNGSVYLHNHLFCKDMKISFDVSHHLLERTFATTLMFPAFILRDKRATTCHAPKTGSLLLALFVMALIIAKTGKDPTVTPMVPTCGCYRVDNADLILGG